MSTWIPFASLILVWILLPLALRPIMRRTELPTTSAALALTAATACIGAVLTFADPSVVLSTAAQDQVYHDTYYIVSAQQRLAQVAFLLLGFAGIAIVAQAIALPVRLFRATLTGHWAFHLGAGLLMAQNLPLKPMPRRYIDYPDVFFWWNLVANAASLLCLGGAILVAGGFLFSLARLMRRP